MIRFLRLAVEPPDSGLATTRGDRSSGEALTGGPASHKLETIFSHAELCDSERRLLLIDGKTAGMFLTL